MYRGSSSEDARAYKARGHADEAEFGRLIGGSSDNLPPQGKTDWVDEQGTAYSVKGDNKKWQIFLYGLDRLKSEAGFLNLELKSNPVADLLEAFPADYATYAHDKAAIKQLLAANNVPDEYYRAGSTNNQYVQSKHSLADRVNRLIVLLNDRRKLRNFLQVSMFNGTEIDCLAIKSKGKFYVFKRADVLDILSAQLTPKASVAGRRADDFNLDAQKVLLVAKNNVVEIEVRNDSEHHYRQLRFNMISQRALQLLIAGTERTSTSTGIEYRELKAGLKTNIEGPTQTAKPRPFPPIQNRK